MPGRPSKPFSCRLAASGAKEALRERPQVLGARVGDGDVAQAVRGPREEPETPAQLAMNDVELTIRELAGTVGINQVSKGGLFA